MAKKYSINWKDGKVVSVEVDGVEYKRPELIPNEEDRAEIMLLMPDLAEMEFGGPSNDPFTKYIALLFLAIGILLLLISAVTAVFTARAVSREVSAKGNVVDLVVRRDSEGNEFYYPVVVFALPDGSLQTVQTTEGSWPPAHEKGAAVTVLYDSEQPSRARIKSAGGTIGRWLWSLITGPLGVIFVIVALIIYWVFNIKMS